MNRTILLVTSNEKSSEFDKLASVLSGQYSILIHHNPVQALSVIRNSPVDIIICDFMQSESNGYDFIISAKQIVPQLLSILVLDNPDSTLLLKCINEANIFYIATRPIDFSELTSAISNEIAKKRQIEDLKKRIDLLERVSNENNRLYELLKENMQYHDDNVLNVIISLANIIEAKDSYTDMHTRRVGSICRRLGKKMNLDDDRLKSLELAGLIHDLGKVGIPENILNKPGKLTAEEFEKMKEHTIIGENICKPMACFEKCLDPIRHHHEKINGTGYPDGLKGDEISLEARIVAVADIFDALYSKRPYRDRLPMDTVMRILKEEADAGCIDKLLVDTLLEMIIKGEIDDIITDKIITFNMRKGLTHEVYGSYKSKDYIENPKYLQLLHNHVETINQPLVLTGEKGSGKTSLLAYWYQHYKRNNPESFVIIHFTSAFDRESISIIMRIMQEIKERYMLSDEIPSDSKKLISDFPVWLSRVQKEKMILIIDSIDQIECDSFDWLPLYFPPNIRAIFSAVEVPEAHGRFDIYGWSSSRLEPLSKLEREMIVERHLGKYKKSFDSELNESAEFAERCSNPLFLRTLIEELKAYTNFKKLDKKLGYYLSSSNLDELYDKVLERLESDFSVSTISRLFSLICISKNGLSEAELMAIGGFSSIVLTGLLASVEYYLIQRDGLLNFSNSYLKEAVVNRYFSDQNKETILHEKIAAYFEKQIISTRIAYALPWHLQLARLDRQLAACISNLEIFNIYFDDNKLYELLGFWNYLGEQYDIADEYLKSLDDYVKIEGITENTVSIMNRIALFLHSSGKYSDAICIFDKAYNIGLELYDCNSDEMLSILKNIGESLLRSGKYIEAEVFFRRILDTRRELLGDEHPYTLTSYNDLILLLNYKGSYAEAEKLIKYLLPLQEGIFGSEHISTAKTLNSLGIILTVKGEFDEAEDIFKRSYSILKKNLGIEHPETLRLLNNLAAVSVDRNNLAAAETLYRKILNIRERVMGKEHHYTAKAMNNLADVLMYLGKFKEAEKWIKTALSIYKKTFIQEHPDTATAQTTIAEIMLAQNKIEEAEYWCMQSIETKKKVYGNENIKLANSLKLLSDILLKMNHINKAKSYCEAALTIFENKLSPNQTEVIKCKELLEKLKDWD